jgi:hypothetical protein
MLIDVFIVMAVEIRKLIFIQSQLTSSKESSIKDICNTAL